MCLAISDHPQQSSAGMIVFFVFFEMASEFSYPLRQNSDLDFRRAGIFVVNSSFFYNFRLLSRG